MTESSLHITLAAGGTGGHVFPAVALGEALMERGHRISFITDERCIGYLKDTRFTSHVIRAKAISGNPFKKLHGIIQLLLGIKDCMRIFKADRPDMVIGFGGYPSFPPMMTALRKEIKTAMHEQNSVMGKVNDFIAPKVDAIATSFPTIEGLSEKLTHKVVHTGNPVRSVFIEARAASFPTTADGAPLNLLVIGGSQGAAIFNTLVPDAIEKLDASIQKRLTITQQCRESDIADLQARYETLGITATLQPFFADIHEKIAQSHLAIARAGASTVAELAMVGRPAIFIPYPHAVGNHQMHNAQQIVEAGGGWVYEQNSCDSTTLSAQLGDLLSNPKELKAAGKKVRKIAQTDTIAKLVQMVEDVTL